jgi:hypothetical protein
MADNQNIEPQETEHENPTAFEETQQGPQTLKSESFTQSRENNSYDRKRFYVEIITVILIFAYTTIALYQGCQMRKATKAAEKSAKAAESAAITAGKALDQSKKVLDANINATQLDQRAWVGVIDVKPAPFGDTANKPVYLKEGFPAIFEIVITNSGKTPALKVKTLMCVKPLLPKAKISPACNRREIPKQSVDVIQPGEHLIMSTPPSKVLNASHIDFIKNGKTIIYLFGIITYQDIFRKKHQTTFCKFLLPSLSSIASCETYNEAN